MGDASLLNVGCNDLGGTLMGEIITRSAEAAHGQEVTPQQFREVIEAAGRRPGFTVHDLRDPGVSAPVGQTPRGRGKPPLRQGWSYRGGRGGATVHGVDGGAAMTGGDLGESATEVAIYRHVLGEDGQMPAAPVK